MHVRASVNQRAHDSSVALRHRPHQRGLVILGFGRVDLRTMGKERGHGRHVPRARTAHQQSLTGRDGRIRIGASREQQLHGLYIRIRTRQR